MTFAMERSENAFPLVAFMLSTGEKVIDFSFYVKLSLLVFIM